MQNATLVQIAVFLAAAAIAAPLAKSLRIGTVLGYLIAGILIGPFGLGVVYSVYDVKSILHFAEFGVILLLFLIGLELRPRRLWAMRAAIFGLGGAQVAATGVALMLIARLLGLAWPAAFVAGFALSLSSTAFALQLLEEKGELQLRHGRLAFGVLLFQDLAAIPLIALTPLLAVAATGAAGPAQPIDWPAALKALAVIGVVVVVGRFVLDRVFRLVAATKVKEAMTASALLTVVGVTLAMEQAGLSASLGAFLAGALLADSDYRHEIEADIAPFEGLLLGLFFTAIGMSLNLRLLLEQPVLVAAVVLGLLAVKAAVLYGLGRQQGLASQSARRLALSISQGGEFAFVLLGAAVAARVLDQATSDLLSVAVTLSMAVTPALMLADEALAPRPAPAAYDTPPPGDGHVVIAGFGRMGQIVARILRARRIPFTALDASSEQVAFVRDFGNRIYYGDASRPEILAAAQTEKARAFVLAIDDVEASVRTATLVRHAYPHVPVIARARNRQHVYRLMDLGVQVIRRETFLSALDLSRALLRALGHSERDVRFAVDTFKAHDERRLYDDYAHASDVEKLKARALSQEEELHRLFDEDEAERAAAAAVSTAAEARPPARS